MAQEVDVIIAGAGAAGLNAALILHRAGKKVIVLESRDRVGGRIKSEKLPGSGTHVELGAQWQAERGHERLNKLVQTYGYRKLEHYTSGKAVVWRGARRHCFSHGSYGIGFFSGLDLMMRGWLMSRTCRKVSFEGFNADLEKYDNTSLQQYVEKRLWTNGAINLLSHILEGGFCRESKDISVYSALQTMKTFDSMQENTEKFFFDEGLQNIFVSMAKELESDVELNMRVVEVDTTGEKVVVKSNTGKTYVGKELILAFPPQLLQRVRFEPPLPSHYRQVASSMVLGQVVKLIAVFPTPWWRKRGLTGSITAFGSNGMGISEVADLSHSTGNGVLAAFVVGPKAEQICQQPLEELRKGFAKFISDSFQSLDEEIQSFHYHNWISDEDSLGAYLSTVGMGQWKNLPDGFFPKTGKVSFAGTEYAQQWRGYMEGALESGERTARAVLVALDSLA
eukprot:Skav235846  [mRNA]  locus=scaffold1931:384241:385593:- [translate_table: standard]